MTREAALESLQHRVDAIEGGYEFLLAYAAQGVASDEGHANSEQLREYLRRMDIAISGLADEFRGVIAAAAVEPSIPYDAFLRVLDRDVESALAALRLVTAQKGISSQLVDNLNASIHVRAVLTDLFLVDQAVKDATR